MAVKAIFLDWDGTLVDSFELNLTAINTTLTHFGKEEIDTAYYAECFGLNSRELFEKLFYEELKEIQDPDARKSYLNERREFYYATKKELGKTTPLGKINGSEELIAFLREKKQTHDLFVGIISNKKESGLLEQIEQSGWADVFDVAVGKVPERNGKPSAAPLNAALAAYPEGKNPPLGRETLYIGDTDTDCDFARKNGLKFIGLGDAITRDLAPEEKIHHLDELTNRLKSLDVAKLPKKVGIE